MTHKQIYQIEKKQLARAELHEHPPDSTVHTPKPKSLAESLFKRTPSTLDSIDGTFHNIYRGLSTVLVKQLKNNRRESGVFSFFPKLFVSMKI